MYYHRCNYYDYLQPMIVLPASVLSFCETSHFVCSSCISCFSQWSIPLLLLFLPYSLFHSVGYYILLDLLNICITYNIQSTKCAMHVYSHFHKWLASYKSGWRLYVCRLCHPYDSHMYSTIPQLAVFNTQLNIFS